MALTVELGSASRPCAGERVSGDAVVIRRTEGVVLYGVIDALGHGEHAHEAAQVGQAFLGVAPLDRGLGPIMIGLHRALRGTRGAAATLLLYGGGGVAGSAVGNVGLRSLGTRLPLLPVPGILGHRFSQPRVFDKRLERGDRQVVFSDGISNKFRLSDYSALSVEDASKALLTQYALAHDDATILVVDVIERSQLYVPPTVAQEERS